MIITGAPVENMEFEEVNYWEELSGIMEWTKTHVTSTIPYLLGRPGGLHITTMVSRNIRGRKTVRIYNHRVLDRKVPVSAKF